jgi:sugar phosphate isomerase/epimerase
MVCHLNYEENKQGYKKEQWAKIAHETWRELTEIAAQDNCFLMLENTYENSPDAHETILSGLPSKHAGFCLDVGHLMSFAKTPWQDWLPRLSPWLGQIHLHDNNGDSDEHLGLGLGCFDFVELFAFLKEKGLCPLITLEPHSEEDLWQALKYLNTTCLLDQIDQAECNR